VVLLPTLGAATGAPDHQADDDHGYRAQYPGDDIDTAFVLRTVHLVLSTTPYVYELLR
jgi:hypothetical protein